MCADMALTLTLVLGAPSATAKMMSALNAKAGSNLSNDSFNLIRNR